MQDVNVPALRRCKKTSFPNNTSSLKTSLTKMSLKPALFSMLLFSSGSLWQVAQAACAGEDCACKPSEFQVQSSGAVAGANGKFPISLEADNVEAQGQEIVSLTGDATVAQGDQSIVADKLKYYRDTERVVAAGNVEMLSSNGTYIRGDAIDVHAQTQIGKVDGAEFKLAKSRTSEDGIDTITIDSRGSADVINLEGEGLVRLEGVDYTRCPEGNDSVVISAGELELDQTEAIGRARNAVIRFKGVPIFYSPYLSFPLNDERKTGLLTPGFGSDEESGNVFELPWYWNIAENQDATITPRYFTDRGMQLSAEYRHKSQRSTTLIYGETLSGDELFGDDRDMFSISHSQHLTDEISLGINYNDVSDSEYFDDFRNDVRYFSASYVPQDASLSYSGDYFNIAARYSEYQIIDDAISPFGKPYERQPVISFSTSLPDGPMGMKYGLYGSHTSFAHDVRQEGTRTALTPYVSMPFESIWGYVTPRLELHNRSYSLDDVEEGSEDSPSFTVPVFSLDSGLYFERNANWFGDSALQTLEPRVFYAYASEEDQSDVPIFDTSSVSLNNFSGIYRANRFYGEDRVGDTNQITLGVTSRFIDNETGDEKLKASVGQLYIIDDQKQSAGYESGLGDLLFALSTSSGAWTTSTFLQYDHDLSEIRTGSLGLTYEPEDDSRKEFELSYYYSNSIFSTRNVDQISVNGKWPLSDRWQIFGSERYSIEDSESISTTLGIEYDSCCWKFRIIGQERLQNNDINDKKTSVYFELELTSLGKVRTGLY